MSSRKSIHLMPRRHGPWYIAKDYEDHKRRFLRGRSRLRQKDYRMESNKRDRRCSSPRLSEALSPTTFVWKDKADNRSRTPIHGSFLISPNFEQETTILVRELHNLKLYWVSIIIVTIFKVFQSFIFWDIFIWFVL